MSELALVPPHPEPNFTKIQTLPKHLNITSRFKIFIFQADVIFVTRRASLAVSVFVLLAAPAIPVPRVSDFVRGGGLI